MVTTQSISFGSILGNPTVTTSAASSVGQDTLTANGNVTDLGPANNSVRRGFYIGTNASYTSNTKYFVTGKQRTGTFTYNATGLSASTTYYVTAFTIGTKGESVGTTVSSTTLSANVLSAYTAGQTTNWTYDQCYCGTANGSGTLGGSYMEIYTPYWGGGGFTTNTTYDLRNAAYVEVDYTTTAGVPAYMYLGITTGFDGTNRTQTAIITGGSGPQVAYSSGAQIPCNFTASGAGVTNGDVYIGTSNMSSSRVRITRVEYF